jgi:hypothetical protein
MSLSVTVKGLSEIDSMMNKMLDVDVYDFLNESGEIIVEEAKKSFLSHFHSQTGSVEKAIKVTGHSQDTITIGVDDSEAPHAVYLHEGTKSHFVAPTKAGALSWVDGGRHFSKGHMVAGITAYPYLDHGLGNSVDKVLDLADKYVEKAIKKAGF